MSEYRNMSIGTYINPAVQEFVAKMTVKGLLYKTIHEYVETKVAMVMSGMLCI